MQRVSKLAGLAEEPASVEAGEAARSTSSNDKGIGANASHALRMAAIGAGVCAAGLASLFSKRMQLTYHPPPASWPASSSVHISSPFLVPGANDFALERQACQQIKRSQII